MLKVYSASEVTFIFAGIDIDGGRGDDEFVAIARPDDSYTYKAGVDGEGTRSFNKKNYRTVTLTLMRTSRFNAVLSAIHTLDLETPGGNGVAPILVRDRQGASLFSSPEAWITKIPDDTYANEAGTVQWVFGVHNPVQVVGGN